VGPLGGRASALSANTVEVVFNDGQLQRTWSSWSWGLSYFNQHDGTAPAPGSTGSLCIAVQPFGALSLRTSRPFAVGQTVMGMHVRGNATSGGSAQERQALLGGLEIQLEGGSGGQYAVSRSATIQELLVEQAAEDGSDAQAQLAAMADGQWLPLRVRLADLSGDGGAVFDRVTLGKCVQQVEACAGEAPAVSLCLDHVVLVSPS
jgi:hypothetical protein